MHALRFFLFLLIWSPGTSSFLFPARRGIAALPTTFTSYYGGAVKDDGSKATTTTTTSNASGLNSVKESEVDGVVSKSSRKFKKFLAKIQSALVAVRASYPYMPLVFAFGLGVRVGRQAIKSSAESAASKPVATASKFPALSLVLFAVAVREVWRGIPNWIKRRIPVLGRKAKE